MTETLPALRESTELAPQQNLASMAPAVLGAMLERRYLTDFDHAEWELAPRPNDVTRPLLHEVTELGRPDAQHAAAAMQNVLTASHERGHAFISVLQGEGDRARLFLGARRLADGGARSTEDYLDAQAGAFKANMPGLAMSPARRMDGAEMPELAEFLATAPALGVVTGIPANRQRSLGAHQNIERVVRAAGGHRYALMIVAEAIDHNTIDDMIDGYRRLKSEVHALARQTLSESKGATRGVAHTEGGEGALETPMKLLSLGLVAQILAAAGLGLNALSGVAGPLQTIALMTRIRDDPDRKQVSEGATWSQNTSFEMIDEHARACELAIDRHLERLSTARANGWWQSAVYVAGESDKALHAVFGALRSLYGGDEAALDPVRVMRLPTADLRPALQYGRILTLAPRDLDRGAIAELGKGAGFDILGTCVNSSELAIMACPPDQEAPGLPVRRRPPFALTAPRASEGTVGLGSLLDHFDRPIAEVGLSQLALNGHVFVTGITGGGKSNTCMRLLIEAHEKWNTPFLVIEPAKAEYRRLAAHPSLSKLRVYSIGADSPLPLRLNPFALKPGVPLLRHIDRLKAVFNASFPMFAGMSYILEEAILEIYEERGWSIYSSQNPFLPERATLDERAALTPSMEDLYDKIDVVLSRRKYGQEIAQNMGAALRSRLKSLMVGSKGMILNTRRGTPLEDLFAQPTIIELQDLGDDEEKAFVMAVLFVLLCEHAEGRIAERGEGEPHQLQHLTLIEEAHRLLTVVRGAGGAESADPRGKAVSMFTDMLAEMRAYGEGFIIADQIPTKLAPEVMKNSNVKIIHRLVAPDDRHAVGQCANLNEERIAHLSTLPRGCAVVHGEDVREAALVQVAKMKDDAVVSKAVRGAKPTQREARQLFRHAACDPCASPCKFFPMLGEARTDNDALAPVFDALLLNDGAAAWTAWSTWRSAQRRRVERGLGRDAKNEADVNGVGLCTVVHAAQAWVQKVDEGRNRWAGDPPDMTPEQRLTREHAGKALAHFAADWLQRKSFDDAARSAAEKANAALADTIADRSPNETDGCETCPVRCRMASFAAEILEPMRAPVARALADASAGVLAKQAQLERALLQAKRSGIAAERAREPALLYCVTAQLSAQTGADADDLLKELASKANNP